MSKHLFAVPLDNEHAFVIGSTARRTCVRSGSSAVRPAPAPGSAGGSVSTMAAAPPVSTRTAGSPENVLVVAGPRPALHLVPDAGALERGCVEDCTRRSPGRLQAASEPVIAIACTGASGDLRGGIEGPQRRARRTDAQRRRRAVALAVVAAGLVGGLALPLPALGGAPAPRLGSAAAAAPGETVYVVRPGDTLWSIATRFDHGGDPRPLAEALAEETGSAVVVPGEHIAIP